MMAGFGNQILVPLEPEGITHIDVSTEAIDKAVQAVGRGDVPAMTEFIIGLQKHWDREFESYEPMRRHLRKQEKHACANCTSSCCGKEEHAAS